jgi:hypothetical protein
MDSKEEPELPLEPAPAINWPGVRKRAYLLLTKPKIPAWAVIVILLLKEIPGWKSRFEFWVEAVKSLGGVPSLIASVIASNYFAPIAGIIAAAYIVLVGEPKKGVQRHYWWPYVGWSVFGILFTAIVVTGIVGYVEIYIKEEVGKRDTAIQQQAAVRPLFWHLTDFERAVLGFELAQLPEEKRFEIKIRCLPDASSRTFVEDIGTVIQDKNWKVSANCLFSNIRADFVGLSIGVAKKHAGKKFEDLPEHMQTMAKILNAAKLSAPWSLDPDDSMGDEPSLIVGNPPAK